MVQDPSAIKSLPEIPTGFLQLMGISSLGYLGGKLTRKPGPVIERIAATYNTGDLDLTINGRNLSREAKFSIGPDEVPRGKLKNQTPVIEPDDQSKEQNMGKVLKLTIGEAKQEWLKDGVELTITNPDGQKAVWPYKIGPKAGPVISIINPPSIKFNQAQPLTVSGSNFDPKCTATIEVPAGTPEPAIPSLVFKDANNVEVTVTLATGTPPFDAALIITNPDGKAAKAPFKVEA